MISQTSIRLISFFLVNFFLFNSNALAQQKEPATTPAETLDWTQLPGKDYGDATWYKLIDLPETTYEDVRKAFYKEWYMKPYESGKMYKQYKRYETLTYGTLTGNQKALDFSESVKAINKLKSKNPNQRMAANWQSLGPNQPLNPSTWNNQGVGRVDEIAFHPTNENIVFAGTPSGGLWKSTDGGVTWTALSDTWTNLGISGIEFNNTNPNTMYVSTGTKDSYTTSFYGIQKSTDGGTTWTLLTVPNVTHVNEFLVDPSDDNKMYLATSSGLYYSADNGITWSTATGISGTIRDLEFRPGTPSTLYASKSGEWYTSINNGASFTLQSAAPFNTSNTGNVAIAVTANNNDAVFFYIWDNAIASFKIYKYSNAANTYTLLADYTAPATYPDGVTTADMTQFFWGQQFYDWSFNISPSDENDMTIGDISAFRTTDGGANWMAISSSNFGGGSIHVDMHTVEYSSTSSTPHIGCDGGIYKFNGNGNQWTRLNNMGISQTYRMGVHPLNHDRIICGNQDNGVFYHNGTQWNYELIGDGGDGMFDPIDSNTFYGTIGPDGSIRKTSNDGGSFTSVFNESSSGESASWQFPIAMHPKLRHVLYAGHSNVWKSIDGGSSWSKITNDEVSTVYHIKIAKANPDYIYMSSFSSSNGMYRSTDGGNTWSACTWPFSGSSLGAMALDPTNELTVYAGSSSTSNNTNRLMKSTDGGITWSSISTGLPSGISVRTLDVVEGLTDELYIGDYTTVYHKSGNNNWQIFDVNLPNAIINEVVVNEVNNTLTAATYGRSMWRSPLENTTTVCYDTTIPILDINGAVNSCNSSQVINITNTPPSGSTIQWYKDETPIAGANGLSYTITIPGNYSAIFETASCHTYSSDFVVVNLGAATNIVAYTESFENDVAYTNLFSDDTDWLRNSGGTPSSNTGPSTAIDGSYYLYVEASNPNNPNKTAILETSCFDMTGYNVPELVFSYHMFGNFMGSIEVQISTDNGATWTSLFTQTGNQGDQWFDEIIDLNAYTGTTAKFRFIGLTGSSWSSDMAIDYIRFQEGSSCVTNLPVTENPIPDGIYKAINLVNSSSTVPFGGAVIFQAENQVCLEPGFEVILGAVFEAFIAGCN